MEIHLVQIGKTDGESLIHCIEQFEDRLKNYIRFVVHTIPNIKNAQSLPISVLKEKEGDLILKEIEKAHFTILLDEHGKQFRSIEFAKYLQNHLNQSTKNIYFVIGGAFGFSPKVYERANAKMSISAMTFSHQLIRLLFTEQLYRGFSILKNEPYHNE